MKRYGSPAKSRFYTLLVGHEIARADDEKREKSYV